jgi:ubiquinone/menaquinone biosynthesis C-methylase UbiE
MSSQSEAIASPSPPTPARLLVEALRAFDPRGWQTHGATASLAMAWETMRTGLFVAESVPLFLLTARRGEGRGPTPPEGALEVTLERLRALLERDAAMIGEGMAPLSVLAPRDPLGHGGRLLRILADGVRVARRRRERSSRDFGREAERWLEELPAYYRRNFHYQTDGYLSESSAELYEHQVELLFRGGADAMRRMVLASLKRHFGDVSGRGLRFLELGSGTGIATRFVAQAFPEARITALDLSAPYTKHARRALREFERVDPIQGDAANLDFGDERFDAVYSVFLFHELPLPVRELVLSESSRVLRPGGFLGLVDSLQKGDDPELDWALDFFPREFHEPYYAHYAANPMEHLVEAAGFESIESGPGYLAKSLSARKPEGSTGSGEEG